MRSLPNILPSVKFTDFEKKKYIYIYIIPVFFVFFGKKKEENIGKKLLVKNGPNRPFFTLLPLIPTPKRGRYLQRLLVLLIGRCAVA